MGSTFWIDIQFDIWCIKNKKILTWSPLFFMAKHKRITCNYVNFILLLKFFRKSGTKFKKNLSFTLCIDDRAAVQLNWLCPTLGKKAKERKRKKKDWQGQKRSTDAFIKYKRPTESWLPERSLTIQNGVNSFLKLLC